MGDIIVGVAHRVMKKARERGENNQRDLSGVSHLEDALVAATLRWQQHDDGLIQTDDDDDLRNIFVCANMRIPLLPDNSDIERIIRVCAKRGEMSYHEDTLLNMDIERDGVLFHFDWQIPIVRASSYWSPQHAEDRLLAYLCNHIGVPYTRRTHQITPTQDNWMTCSVVATIIENP